MKIAMSMVLLSLTLSCQKPAQSRNIQTVKKFLQLLESEKIDQFVDLFAENGKQLNPYASGLFPASVEGKAALKKFWEPVPGRFNGMKFPITKVYPMQDQNLVLVNFQGDITLKPKGKYKNNYYALFEFNNQGKILTYTEIFNPIEVVRAFGLKDKI